MNSQVVKKRKYKRLEVKDRVSLSFEYAIESSLDISLIPPEQKKGRSVLSIYHAVAKNVSVEGMCFHSEKKLNKGKILDLKLFLPGSDKSVHMQGKVRWSAASSKKKNEQGFDTGVRLMMIEEKSVQNSVYFDEEYHLYWSDVLETVMEGFKKIGKRHD